MRRVFINLLLDCGIDARYKLHARENNLCELLLQITAISQLKEHVPMTYDMIIRMILGQGCRGGKTAKQNRAIDSCRVIFGKHGK